MRRASHFRELQVRGSQTVTANGQVLTCNLSEVQPIAKVPGGHTYLVGLHVAIDAVYTEVGGGDDTLEERRALDVLDEVRLSIPGEAKPIYNVVGRAGSLLHNLIHAATRKRPRSANGGGSITITKSTTTNVRSKHWLPIRWPQFSRPRDFDIPLALLQDAILTIKVAGASLVHATDPALTTATVQVFAELVEKNEFTTPTFFNVENLELSGLSEKLPLEGLCLAALIESGVNGASGLVANPVTSAERTTVRLTIDGDTKLQDVNYIDLAARWNIYVPGRDEELPDVEGDACPFVPIVAPPAPVKLTELDHCKKGPQLVVAGTDTTPHVVWLATQLTDRMASRARLAKAGVPLPRGANAQNFESYLGSKTLTKDPAVAGDDGAHRLPMRLHDQAAQ